MENYRPNSHRSKKEEETKVDILPKIKPVATGVRKKKLLNGILGAFLNEDVDDAKKVIIEELIIPGLKEFAMNSLEVILTGSTSGSRRSSNGSKTSYTRYYDDRNRRRDDRDRDHRRSGGRYNYDEIALRSRADAEEVRAGILDIFDHYDTVTVANYYELCHESSDWPDHKYGWTRDDIPSIERARVVHTRDGFILQLPKAYSLD